jgi:integrase
VDLVRRRLIVSESASEVGGRLVWSTPKSHQSRTVPLPQIVVGDLTPLVAGRSGDELVFTSPQGGPLRLNNWRRRVFDPACEACELSDVTPHDLRHTAASLAVSAGANIKAVQRMLGHASAAMTLDVYASLFDEDLDAVADALNALVPPVCPAVELTEADEGREPA